MINPFCANVPTDFNPGKHKHFKCQPCKMVKHTQTIRRQTQFFPVSDQRPDLAIQDLYDIKKK